MKNYFIFLVACVFMAISCKKEKETPVDYIVFSGEVTNSNAKYVNVYSSNFLKNISIDSTGNFIDTILIDKNGYYNYKIGPENSRIYLTKGTNLHLTIDAKQFDESISYTGTGAENNVFLADKYLFNEQFNGTKEALVELNSKKANQFKERIDFQKNALIDLLLSMKLSDTLFVSDQIKGAHYDYLTYVNEYLNFNSHFPKENDSVALQVLKGELAQFDIDNEEDYNKHEAYQFLMTSLYMRKSIATAKRDSIPNHMAFINGLAELKSPTIKNALLEEMIYYISPGNPDSDKVYEALMQQSTDSVFQKRITASFDKIKLLAKGKSSPTFNYENYKGGKTALADLKGKYVYIDVWATWCAPCIQEIPFLKELEKEYHGKNIEFVSISVDAMRDYEKWKEMVTKKELTGVQLFADNDWKSKFVQEYDIKGIPRFILIDPDGNIVNASAPRPSNPILKEIFKGLNI